MQDEIRSHFRNQLIKIRKDRGFSQEEMANLLSCSPSKVGYIESGRTDINGRFLDHFADTFGVSLDELVSKSPEQQLNPLSLKGLQRNIEFSKRIRFFEGPLVSLPLQHDGYLRVIVYELNVFAELTNPELFEICEKKREIQKKLRQKRTEVIITNQSLYQHIGGPRTMISQIDYLIENNDSFEIVDPAKKVLILPVNNFCIFDSRATSTETPYGMLFSANEKDTNYIIQSWKLLLKSRATRERKDFLLSQAREYWQQVLAQE